jgi:hypothetical protein
MPIEIAVAGPVNNAMPVNRRLRVALAEAAQQLEFAALFGGPGTIAEEEPVRIDVQGPWGAGPGLNIQAQVGNGTIAGIRLAESLGRTRAEEQAVVVEAVRAALIASANDGLWRDLTGRQP